MSLSNIFTPQSIAIIGASAQEGSVGYAITKNLVGEFGGKVIPINPKNTEILGTKCYASISDLEMIPDLVIVVVPAKIVPIVLQQVADKGVKGVVIISAGFKEIGGEGVELESKIKEICKSNNISLIGPNCLGVINPWIKMNGSFANSVPPKGNIAFLSQSGAICTAVIDYASKLGLGFSKFVSVGNKALSSEVGMIKYLQEDDQTDVIAIYAEGLTNASEFIETMKTITKPVVILKSGRTNAGSGASSSHTGALASEDILYETLFGQAGITRASSIQELFDIMQVLSRYHRSLELKSKIKVAIITNAGGPGVLTTDCVVSSGMELAQISPESLEKLKLSLPPTANFHNPFDLIGDAPAQRYRDALEVLTQDSSVDAIIVILTPQTTTEIDLTAQIISEYSVKSSKPIIASFIGGDKVLSGVEILRKNKVVHIDFPENAARALSVKNPNLQIDSKKDTKNFNQITNFDSESAKFQSQQIFDDYKSKSEFYIPEVDAKKIFENYDIPTVKSVYCKTSQEVEQSINSIFVESETKLILKIMSPDVMHKSDIGGIKIGVSLQNARYEYDQMMKLVASNLPNARLDGVLFSQMVDLSEGVEFILGAKKDPMLGTAIMFGLGGTMVELINDVVFGFGKLSREDIVGMISKLKSQKIIDGYRGKNPLDLEAIIDTIYSLSRMLQDFPNITEVDMNPVLVGYRDKGVKILDAKIVFE